METRDMASIEHVFGTPFGATCASVAAPSKTTSTTS
jgi:hypothetical protein